MRQLPVAYQLYSAREAAARDLNAVLQSLRKLGYDGVEFAGFYGHSAKEVKEMLDRNDLVAVSSHVPVSDIEKDMFGVIAYHQAIECSYIAVPFLDSAHRPGAPGFAQMIQMMHTFGRLCRKAGIQLLYHNHDFEFVPVCGMYGLDFLYAAVDEKILKTEIDVCWVKYAGVDPAEYLRKYTGRAPIVHMKDYVGQKTGGTPYGLLGQAKQADAVPFAYKPLGYGCQDMQAVTQAAVDAGAKWLVVEQDECYDQDPMEDARKSMETLRGLGVKA